MNPREVSEFAKKNKVQVVDLKFVDLLGTWQHFSIPVEELTEGLFKDGSGLDGSSIRGWKAINDSDLLMVPDSTTACLDPFCAVPTLSLVGNVLDPITREPYDRDPRFVAQKAEKYLQSTKIGDISYWGPEAEFFIFDQVRFDQYGPRSETNDFPVLTDNDTAVSSLLVSEMIARMPPIEFGLIFVPPELKDQAKRKIEAEWKRLLDESPKLS
jgi:glutamine synthetase